MTAEILGLGEPLIEMVRLPDPIDGRPAYVQGFGGDTSTAIIAAARQGAKAGYISAVGDDMFGDALRDLWTRESVDHTHVLTRKGEPPARRIRVDEAHARRVTCPREHVGMVHAFARPKIAQCFAKHVIAHG